MGYCVALICTYAGNARISHNASLQMDKMHRGKTWHSSLLQTIFIPLNLVGWMYLINLILPCIGIIIIRGLSSLWGMMIVRWWCSLICTMRLTVKVACRILWQGVVRITENKYRWWCESEWTLLSGMSLKTLLQSQGCN